MAVNHIKRTIMEAQILTHTTTARPLATDGPMAGIRVGVEPNISVENWPTTANSLALKGYVALEDAAPVSRLKAAGACLVGRTAMAELGLGLDNDTGPAALSQGLVDLVLKTDTAGEARVLAGMGQGFGFKPSYGIVSRFGLMGLVPSMESCALLSNSLGTLTDAARVMAGIDAQDPSMDPKGTDIALKGFDRIKDRAANPITLGVVDTSAFAMGPNDQMAFEKSVDSLKAAGICIKTVHIKDLCLAKTIHNIIGSVEASSSAGRFDSVRYGHRTTGAVKNWNEMYIKSRGESFGALVKAFLFQGGYFQYKNYPAFLDACRVRARLVQAVEKALGAVDLLLLPLCADMEQAGHKALTLSGLYRTFCATLMANLTGNPSLCIPGPASGKGPALQLVGPRFKDADLLSLGSRIAKIHSGKI